MRLQHTDSELFEELCLFIERISSNFNEDWLVTEQDEYSKKQDESSSGKGPEIYEKAWKYERHRYIELFMCVKGTCALQINDKVYNLEEGNVCLVLPDEIHSEMVRNKQDYLGIWLAIHLGKVRVHMSGNNYYRDSFFYAEGRFIEFEHAYNFLLSTFRSETQKNKLYHKELIKACILQLLIVTLRRIQGNQVRQLDYEEWKESVVMDVKDFIEKNYSRNPKLNDVSQEVCVSPNHLNTIFKSITGKTIMQYMEEYRIEVARCLLCNTTQSVKSISEQLGYYDQYHFSKVFKKLTGYSPTQYRKIEI
jgi:AraC family transcriptional activator of pobA